MWLELSLLIYTCLLYIMISGSMIFPWYFNIEIIGYLPDLWYIHDILIYLKLLDTCLTEWDICILHVLITKISPSDGQSVLNLSNFTKMSFDLQRNGAEIFLGGSPLEADLGGRAKISWIVYRNQLPFAFSWIFSFCETMKTMHPLLCNIIVFIGATRQQASNLAPINNAINLIKFEHHSPFTGSYMRILRAIITFMMKMIIWYFADDMITTLMIKWW